MIDLYYVLLEATGRRHQASIRSDNSQLDIKLRCLFMCFLFFHGQLIKKGFWGYVKAPIYNRGMTHQNDEKDLSNTTEYLVGGVKLAE